MMLRSVFRHRKFLNILVVLSIVGSMVPASFADTKYRRVYDPQTRQYYYVPEDSLRDRTRSAMSNPVIKQAAIGAAIGGATGIFSDRTSVLRGAGIGALAGAGTGLVDNSRSLQNKPLMRTALKGAIIGTGAGAATRSGAMKGALIGAGAGTGLHFIKDYLGNNRNDRYDYDRWSW